MNGGDARGKDYFSPDYFTARSRFLDAARSARARCDALELSARGPTGEALTIDVACIGDDRPETALLHISGIHGVEGFAGSAIQLQFLDRMPAASARGSAIGLVHTLNPYGMAWLRRSNENNVDLNRNFLGKDERYEGMPPGYAQYDRLLNPASAPRAEMFLLRGLWLIARYGMPRLKEAIATGQYERPKGLFFGGKEIQEGARLFEGYVAGRFPSVKRLVVVDVHTGLGKTGKDSLIVHPTRYERLRAIFGERVAPADANLSVAYPIRGGLCDMLSRVFDNVELDFLGQEFGTRPPIHVVYALREENRWHHLAPGSAEDRRSKQALKEAFCLSAQSWRDAVLRRGDEVLRQCLALLTPPNRS